MMFNTKPKILALDLALTTGWAHSDGTSGVHSFKRRRGDSPGILWFEFSAWLILLIEASPTDIIVYEQAHHRGGAPTRMAYGWITCVEQVVASNQLEVTTRHSSSIKAHALKGVPGKRNKARMIMAAENKWPEIKIIDDNHADSLWLLDLVQTELC